MSNETIQQPPAPARVGYQKNASLLAVKLALRVVRAVSSEAAAKLALKLFLTPPKHRPSAKEQSLIEKAVTHRLMVAGKDVAVYEWGAGEKLILLCHAWGGRGGQLGAFVAPLIARDYRVVAFDAPAHGASTGNRTDMVEYASTVKAIANQFGPLWGILGHSFGAGNVVYASHDFDVQAPKMVLIGCFSNAIWVTEAFGTLLGIPEAVVARMRALLEAEHPGKLYWDKLSISAMLASLNRPTLLIHDEDDQEIPYWNAELLRKESPCKTELYSTKGFGHRRIVRNDAVVERAVEFLTAASA
ncbi:alpha/beta hydrolase [Dyella monticola]|uniref:Alpha/beta hydrolase n=1 Tax=Dyella monticola TaxID=1927958 RepID=A0A370X1Z4_9GAMM|nr:alpha/beta hydrolase [Dyella monticola]RDS82297.1 alpha/beta hydrolase [Dyella monticola]